MDNKGGIKDWSAQVDYWSLLSQRVVAGYSYLPLCFLVNTHHSPPPPPPLSPECSITVNNWSNVTPVNKSTYFSQGCEADDDVEDQSYHQKAEPDTVSQETQENTQVSLPIC